MTRQHGPVQQRSFRWQGVRLGFEEHGQGDDVVVLMHGLLLDAGINRALAARLAASGYRVLLLDLAGHGTSDKPTHASYHRMDSYADQVVALLDELGVDSAVVGGVSLGANVSLYVADRAPERVRALVVEMPVLESAAPTAYVMFVPLLLAMHYARPAVRLAAAARRRLPPSGSDLVDSTLGLVAEPEQSAAVLHGILVGPLAPPIERRAAITAPVLVIGHEHDRLHPFHDADNLARQVPSAQLVRARSLLEMRLSPDRLVRRIEDFLAESVAVRWCECSTCRGR